MKNIFLFSLATLVFWACQSEPKTPAPVAPMPVVPSERQIAYQELEMVGFVHFTVNTFTDLEWGYGTESPSIFNPTELDARQWVQSMKDAGIQLVILTAKHHDGFCLWPSAYTDHSVKSSSWKNGQGDVVRELADACKEAGLKMGLYLSPWDRHEPKYGTAEYNDYYKMQLTELMTQYGEISEVWFDGAKGEGAKDMEYDFDGFWGIVREKQPNAVLFSDAGPDVRWVGNEKGFAGETNWSTITRAGIEIGKADTKLLNAGDSAGRDWMVAECDVSVRPGWFYHAKEDTLVKSVAELVDIYYKSVGRNGTLLLNVPPDRRGLFHETDVARLKAFGETIRATFANNLAASKSATASETRGDHPTYAANLTTDGDPATYWASEDGTTSGWVEIDLGQPITFDRAMLREPVRLGQRISAFRMEIWENEAWKPIANGTTVGYKRLLRFDPVTTSKVRVVVEHSLAVPLLSEIGLYQAAPGEKAE